MVLLEHEKYLSMRDGARVLEADLHGEKVLKLVDGRILKLFRRKRLISSAAWYPYAQRFSDNCKGLAQRGVPCPSVVEVYRVPSIARDAVLYRPLEGETIRQIIAAGLSEDESAILRRSVSAFIGLLNDKGIYFRSLHLGNVVRMPSGSLGLIDVADMMLKQGCLGFFARRRNRMHLLRYPDDARWLGESP